MENKGNSVGLDNVELRDCWLMNVDKKHRFMLALSKVEF